MSHNTTIFGDIVRSSLTGFDPAHRAAIGTYSNYSLVIGQIQAFYAVDDKQNQADGSPGQYSLYDVLIYNDDGTTELARKCRMLQPGFGGSINNFLENSTANPGFKAKDFGVAASEKPGAFVLLAFIGGNKHHGVILGAMPHPGRVAVSNRPDKAEGTLTEGEIQGLHFLVDNDGQLIITFNGPRDEHGALTSANGPTTIKVDTAGCVTIATNNKQKIFVDRTNQKIQIQGTVVEVGDSGLQPMVVGNDWRSIMTELIETIEQIIVPTGVGPSGTPINNPKFEDIKSRLNSALSTKHTVQK